MFLFLNNLLQDIQLPEATLANLASVIAAGAMVFGGVVPYIPQYFEIKRSNNTEGFSTFVCLTLLIANTLRILFWFGHSFELPLLVQSIVMIVTMLVMVHVCTMVKTKSEIIATKPRVFSECKSNSCEDLFNLMGYTPPVPSETEIRFRTRSHSLGGLLTSPSVSDPSDISPKDFDKRYFWKWTEFSSYLEFMLLFTVIVGAITYFFLDAPIYVEVLGFLAVLFEAMLGAPQFYRNFQNKSTKGMSIKMVGMWTCGDIFKTIYFLVRSAPMQFWMCGILQVSLDFSILGQVYYYSVSPFKGT